MRDSITMDSNPEGINQYTGGGAKSKEIMGKVGKTEKGSITERVPDEKNPKYALQTHPTATLAESARGERDLNQHAKVELANRGLDKNGKWVGFEAAAKEHGVTSNAKHDPVNEHFQTMHKDVLTAAARGNINLNTLAKQELNNRGLDNHGKWVGFK